MIRCQECQADNLAGSRFCRLCGKPLPLRSPVPNIRPEDIDRVLSEGYRVMHSGDVEEALFLADAVLGVDPENSSALALKGLCLEKLGDLEGAVSVYEELVVRNPDSPLDRIKLAQLRRKLGSVQKDEEVIKARKALAVLGSILATLLVGIGGTVLALFQSSPSPPAEEVTAQQTLSGFDFPEPSARQPAGDSPPNSEAPPSSAPSGGSASPPVSGSFPRPNVPWLPPVNFEISPSPQGGTGTLPAVGTSPSPSPSPAPQSPGESRPSREPGDENVMPPPSEPPPRNPGTVIITPRGENAEASPRAVSENIYRIAQQKMAAGDYAGAIRDFLTALNGSDKPALIHQLLGRCYKNLKEVAKAREHFEKAISLYESAARAGSEEAKAAMEACRKELQSLGG